MKHSLLLGSPVLEQAERDLRGEASGARVERPSRCNGSKAIGHLRLRRIQLPRVDETPRRRRSAAKSGRPSTPMPTNSPSSSTWCPARAPAIAASRELRGAIPPRAETARRRRGRPALGHAHAVELDLERPPVRRRQQPATSQHRRNETGSCSRRSDEARVRQVAGRPGGQPIRFPLSVSLRVAISPANRREA